MTVFFETEFNNSDWSDFDNPPQVVSSYHAQVLSYQPLAYWRLNDVASGTAADSSGSIHGTYSGGVSQAEEGALFRSPDNGAVFNGVDGVIHTTDDTLLNDLTECTVLFWMKHAGPVVTEDGGIFSCLNANTGYALWVDASAGGTPRTLTWMVFPSWQTSQACRLSGSADLITPGQWDFYACVFKGGQYLQIYKNGILDAEISDNVLSWIPVSDTVRRIGDGNYGAIGHLDATLDELAVLSQALDAAQIQVLYQVGLGRPSQVLS